MLQMVLWWIYMAFGVGLIVVLPLAAARTRWQGIAWLAVNVALISIAAELLDRWRSRRPSARRLPGQPLVGTRTGEPHS